MKPYNKPLKKHTMETPIEEVITETVEVPIEEENTIEEVNEEPVFNPIKGVVVNCTSLYVRMAPHGNATPIDTLNAGELINIIGEEGEFWKLEKPEGYSMKKFIKVV